MNKEEYKDARKKLKNGKLAMIESYKQTKENAIEIMDLCLKLLDALEITENERASLEVKCNHLDNALNKLALELENSNSEPFQIGDTHYRAISWSKEKWKSYGLKETESKSSKVTNKEWVEPMHKDEIGFAVGRCPNCEGEVYDNQNYCDYCGQYLDWSD